ncbi:hypothetical protein CRG98_046412 [Punica granatum]|uniref:Uncharacterized protein n=1 Tax=Punica granatum TaxID=22663 RepID=A0A2I0HNE0_PUNGR|nr:hypothetical protein CRG98_046412 [Punica granatum]
MGSEPAIDVDWEVGWLAWAPPLPSTISCLFFWLVYLELGVGVGVPSPATNLQTNITIRFELVGDIAREAE